MIKYYKFPFDQMTAISKMGLTSPAQISEALKIHRLLTPESFAVSLSYLK